MTDSKINNRLTKSRFTNIQKDSTTQEAPTEKTISQKIANIFNSIKNWFNSTFSSVLETQITNIVSEKDEDQSMAHLADLIGDIGQKAPEKLEEIHMFFDESQGELNVIFGDSDPLTYQPETKKEYQGFKKMTELSDKHPTFEDLRQSYRESMQRDYRRANSGVKIFNGNEIYDITAQSNKILEKVETLDTGDKKNIFLDTESQSIADHALEIYDSHLPGKNSSKALLEALSCQAFFGDLTPQCMAQIPKIDRGNDTEDFIYMPPQGIKKYINIYKISQESFFVDVNVDAVNQHIETGEVVPSSHRFQLLISPSSFHIVGKQHDISKFPEQVQSN